MTADEPGPGEHDPLVSEVRRREERRRRRQAEGEPSLARSLAQIGVLGWIVVTPILLGIFAGRWLDARLDSGVFWTAPLVMLGAALGSWSAWKWVNRA